MQIILSIDNKKTSCQPKQLTLQSSVPPARRWLENRDKSHKTSQHFAEKSKQLSVNE